MGDVLAKFFDALWQLFSPIADFLLSFLPDGDAQIYAIIDGVGGIGGDLTFNVFYFVDWPAVLACFGVLVTVILVINVTKIVLKGLDIGHKAIESIPVIE